MLRIMSCNVRYSRAQDGENSWPHRREVCAAVIAAARADVVCLQEATPEQLEYLRASLPGYGALCTLDRPKDGEPVNTILYREDLLVPKSTGAYWLSETPHVCGSRSWQSLCIRLAQWALFTVDRGGWELRLVNTHLDHVSQQAREEQARLVNEDAAAYDDEFPQVLTGDMNADVSNPAIRSFLAAGWTDAHSAVTGVTEPGRTHHGFLGDAAEPEGQGKIDWILVRGPVQVRGASIIKDTVDGRYPSDHYFVSADVGLR